MFLGSILYRWFEKNKSPSLKTVKQSIIHAWQIDVCALVWFMFLTIHAVVRGRETFWALNDETLLNQSTRSEFCRALRTTSGRGRSGAIIRHQYRVPRPFRDGRTRPADRSSHRHRDVDAAGVVISPEPLSAAACSAVVTAQFCWYFIFMFFFLDVLSLSYSSQSPLLSPYPWIYRTVLHIETVLFVCYSQFNMRWTMWTCRCLSVSDTWY